MMKKRLIVLLVFLILLPSSIAVWMGVRSLQEGQAAAVTQVGSLWSPRLLEIRSNIRQFVQTTEEQIRIRQDRHPLVVQRFLVINGKPTYPPRFNKDGTQLEFYQRTKDLWTEKFWEKKSSEDGPESDSGWINFGSAQVPGIVYWIRESSNRIVGYELEPWTFLSKLSETLPEFPWTKNESLIQTLVLRETSGKSFAQWGNWDHRDTTPILTVGLEDPFSGWELRFYYDQAALPGMASQMTSVYFFIGSALVVLLGVGAFLFFRSMTSSLREAQQRVNFVNQVSHELKTPLTNILLYGELLESHLPAKSSAKTQEYLSIIRSESQRLGRLIHNVLTFARRNRGDQPHLRLYDWNSLLEKSLLPFLPLLKEKGMQLEWNRSSIELDGNWDGDWVEQIVGNLVSNAEKYGSSGNWVGIETGGDDECVWLNVKDRGPGIPKSQREKIFHAFYRIENKLTSAAAGSGLGLAIARELTEKQGGKLTIEDSELGAFFRLVLPRKQGKTL